MTFQYASVTIFSVFLPLLSMSAWMRRSMLYTRDSQQFLGDFSDPCSLVCLRFSALDDSLYATLSFIIGQRFSIGLRSGLFLDIPTHIICFQKRSMCLWYVARSDIGAPSCHTWKYWTLPGVIVIGLSLRGRKCCTLGTASISIQSRIVKR